MQTLLVHQMEELSSSPVKSVLTCSEGPAQSEESTWTEYFVDFMLSEEEEKKRGGDVSCYSDGDDDEEEEEEKEGSSMISDAASCAPGTLPGKCKELKKLKKKVFRALDDDSLEDTASSPVNSPKVSALSQLELSPTKNYKNRSLSKGCGVGDHAREAMDSADVSFVERSNACAELKEKGLCLFPFSMLLDYHR